MALPRATHLAHSRLPKLSAMQRPLRMHTITLPKINAKPLVLHPRASKVTKPAPMKQVVTPVHPSSNRTALGKAKASWDKRATAYPKARKIRPSPTSTHKNKLQDFEHPWLRAFKEHTADYKSNVQRRISDLLREAQSSVQARVQGCKDETAKHKAGLARVASDQEQSLANRTLTVRDESKGRSQATEQTITFGHRIAQYKDTVRKETARLQKLCREWDKIQAAIQALQDRFQDGSYQAQVEAMKTEHASRKAGRVVEFEESSRDLLHEIEEREQQASAKNEKRIQDMLVAYNNEP